MFRDYDANAVSFDGQVQPSEHEALPPGFPGLPVQVRHALPPKNTGGVTSAALALRASLSEAPKPGKEDLRQLAQGAYAILFTPDPAGGGEYSPMVGVARLERLPEGKGILLSGDLYLDLGISGSTILMGREIPAYPTANYWAYFRGNADAQALGSGNAKARPNIPCELHPILSKEWNLWYPGRAFELKFKTNPPGSGLILEPVWDVYDERQVRIGEMSWRWLSEFFREAVIEVDSEAGYEPHLSDGNGNTIESVFAEAGWKVQVESGSIEVPTPPSGAWTLAEIHEAMLRSRREDELDYQWRYHVSIVGYFSGAQSIGIAYDHEAGDLNKVPREDVAVQIGAVLPKDPVFGSYAGRRLLDTPELSFLVILHELGHAMGLYHNHAGYGIMQQIDDLALDSRDGHLTRQNLLPEFDGKDLFRLRHLPEIYVRPGGIDFETVGVVEDREDAYARAASLHLPSARSDREGPFGLNAEVVQARAPFGSPVRVDFSLENRSGRIQRVPARISLGTPFVRGWVIGPGGEENEFRSLFKPISADGMAWLGSGESLAGSMTLLRGRQGSLFSRPGIYTIWVEVGWLDNGERYLTRQRAEIRVGPPESRSHELAAREIVRTPETLGYLALGRSRRFSQGAHAVDRALDTPELHFHYAYLKARELGRGHNLEKPNHVEAGRLLEPEESLHPLNRSEILQANRLRELAGSPGQNG